MLTIREDYRFGFNGQEKVNEIAGTGNHNTALFWEYDTRLGRRWNLDPKPTIGISHYATFGNNPITFSDVLGDSVNVSGMYERKNGNLVNPEKVKAFELFASSKEGKQYLMDHAQAGFKLQGEFVKDLNIQATEEGVHSKAGVDITFTLGDGVTDVAGAYTSSTIVGGRNRAEGGRLKTSFVYPRVDRPSMVFTRPGESLLYGVGVMTHEPFLHGLQHRSNYYKNYMQGALGGHDHQSGIFDNSYFAQKGLSVMRQSQAQIMVMSYTGISLVSEARMGAMMQWGRGVPGWDKLSGINHEGKTETESYNAAYNAVQKIK